MDASVVYLLVICIEKLFTIRIAVYARGSYYQVDNANFDKISQLCIEI